MSSASKKILICAIIATIFSIIAIIFLTISQSPRTITGSCIVFILTIVLWGIFVITMYDKSNGINENKEEKIDNSEQ